ncbi:MAG: nickel pincer cofactor biosynthesis protein LarB [Gemmataceae bacterium]|nr:nickel pincer cofactor biosynthesis protein LarB [Gemmataceae bacterium]
MGGVDFKKLLEEVRDGKLDVATALQQAGQVGEPIYAHLDLDRKRRCGFPEVILAEGKTLPWLEGLVSRLAEASQDCFATRLSAEQMEALGKKFPAALIDSTARTFLLRAQSGSVEKTGTVAILTAGTGDLPVAREALATLEALGVNGKLIPDVGVAGLHRLLSQQEAFIHADAIVVAAGMDGALPSVVGGLVSCPVIAVPTSIGYGASFHGLAALMTMLNACPANVVVVNIDAGFKAGFAAALIARQSHGKKNPV